MADAKMLKKVPVREQDPKVRATNFEEVCLGYNQEEAMEEAQRCLGCKKPKCVEGCPVSINIPGFIEEIKEGKIEEAYKALCSGVSYMPIFPVTAQSCVPSGIFGFGSVCGTSGLFHWDD